MRHPLLPTSRWRCRSAIALLAPACLTLYLTACSRPAPHDAITVVDGRGATVVPTPARPVTPAPTPAPAPSRFPTPPRQRFTSPPLPPELADDGALKPLPARPPAEAFGQGEQH